MKHKIFISLLIFFLFLGIGGHATTRYIANTTNNPGVSIPSNASKYASDKDIVEMVCYKAKWKGGEGVARIEALEMSASPFLEKLENIGIKIEDAGLSEKAKGMRNMLEEVCSAASTAEASLKVNNYISYTESIRSSLENDFSSNLRGTKDDLEERGKEIKERIEEELEEEAQKMAKEAEEELRKMGEEEGKAIESQLRNLGSEFEAFMSRGEVGPGEARAKARELSGRISADSETKSFLESKFADILNEADGLIGQAMSGEISPAQIKNIVQQKVPAKVAEIKTFMENKYRKMGEEKENEIRTKLEEKAEEIGGEERKQLEEIRDIATSLENNINTSFEEKKKEWEEYEKKYLQKKAEIISKAIEVHFKEAEDLIKENKDKIDLAVEEGVAEEFGILSYAQLLENLEKDKQEIIERLTQSDLSDTAISAIQREFIDKWNDYRKKMEVVEAHSPQKVIDVITERYDIDAHIKEIEGKIENENRKETRQANRVMNAIASCEKNPSLTRSPVPGKWNDSASMTEVSVCAVCLAKDHFEELFNAKKNLHEESLNYLEKLKNLSKQLSGYKNSPPETLKEALDFRDELMTSGDELLEMEEKTRQMAQNSSWNENYQTCVNLSQNLR
jgi:DNA repair exonuclease SbcCD ATPase subunit